VGYAETIGGTRCIFSDVKTLLAKATPRRSGDLLAGIAHADQTERVAAQRALANLPVRELVENPVVPYEADAVTRLIVDSHDGNAFAPISAMTVGQLRDWLLSDAADSTTLARLASGLTPETVAAVSKIMRLQDLVSVAAKCRVVTRFRNTIGLEGRLSTRLQPNHPTSSPMRGPATRCTQCLSPGASPPRSRPTGAKPSCCAPPPATGRPICDAPTWAGGSLGKRLATEASRLVPESG
jgi:ethanolamine ammonia-lyase large subunit